MESPLSRRDLSDLFERSQWVRKLAVRLVGDAHLAEDVVQEAWIVARERGRDPGEHAGFFGGVVRNLALRRRRSEEVRRYHEEAASRRSTAASGGDAVERVRVQRGVTDAVLALPEPYREAVVLKYFDELSSKEIAERQGCTSANARQRVSRGLALLRAKLDEEHGGDRGAWCVALAGLWQEHGLPAVGGGLGLTSGVVMGIKAGAAAMAAIVVVLALWIAVAGGSGAGVDAEREFAVGEIDAPARENDDEVLRASESGTRVPVAGTEERGGGFVADEDLDLFGVVLDPDGEPVEGARVEASHRFLRGWHVPDPETAQRARTVAGGETDDEGRFALRVPLGVPHDLYVVADGFARAGLADRYAGERVVVRLAQPATLTGRVVLAGSGTPAPRAFLHARFPGGGPSLFDRRTDGAGRFRLEGLPPGSLDVLAWGEGDGEGAPAWTRVALEAGGENDVVLELPVGRRITGEVLERETGRPVAGARVQLNRKAAKWTLTDGYGRFTLTGVPYEAWERVHVLADGYVEASSALHEGREDHAIRLFVDRAARVKGRAVDARGEPVPSVYVAVGGRAQRGRETLTHWRHTLTDHEGRFTIDGVARDAPQALFLHERGYAVNVFDLPRIAQAGGEHDVGDVVLDPGASVRGRIVDERGHPRPCEAVVLAGYPSNREALLTDAGKEESAGARLNGVLDERHSRTDERARFSFGDLAPGTYTLEVYPTRPGPPRARVSVTVERGQELEGVEVVVTEGLVIDGRVVSAAGDPVPDATLFFMPLDGSGNDERHAQTDGEGRFHVAGLEAGAFLVQVHPYDHEDGPALRRAILPRVEAGERDLRVVLEEAAPTRGRVLSVAGEPVAGAPVSALDGARRIEVTFTARDGSFELDLPPGSVVTLRASAPNPNGGVIYDVEDRMSNKVEVEDVEAGAQGLVLRLPEPLGE